MTKYAPKRGTAEDVEQTIAIYVAEWAGLIFHKLSATNAERMAAQKASPT